MELLECYDEIMDQMKVLDDSGIDSLEKLTWINCRSRKGH